MASRHPYAPRDRVARARLNEAEYQRLLEASELLGITKTEVITRGIERVHAEAIARAKRNK